MRTTTRLLLFLSVTVGALYAATLRKQSNLPSWVECTSNVDCAPGYCCTISHERYSYPRCQRLHQEGEWCRPSGPLVTNGSRYYPDMSEIVLDDVYMMFCPCSLGLACDRDDAVCRDASDMKDFNYLVDGPSSKKDD